MALPLYLLWTDLETTGLSPENDAVLEVGIYRTPFTDPFRLLFETGDPFVGSSDGYDAVLSARDWDGVDSYVVDMHVKNGLIVECLKSPICTVDVEEKLLIQFPEPPLVTDPRTGKEAPGKYVLAGSSVHFDLGFIRASFPEFAKRLSHRVYDVSAVKLFCQSLGMPEAPEEEKKEAVHRVKEDIRASVEAAAKCHEWLTEHYGR